MDGYLPYRFTGKELDEETGLYYYGQRYLDPKYNIWMTSDPAIYDYMSQSKNGEGGIYNITNLNLYHYAGNNPIKYTDPDGRFDVLSFMDGSVALPGAVANPISRTEEKADTKGVAVSATDTKKNNSQIMYHYTNVAPKDWRDRKTGVSIPFGVLAPGSYITSDLYTSGELASDIISLVDGDGNPKIPKYRISYTVKEGEYLSAKNSLPGSIVDALHGRNGGGREFVNTVILIPIDWEAID